MMRASSAPRVLRNRRTSEKRCRRSGSEMSNKLLAVISVQGRDQKGVVAQFATFVAERGINIEDMEQRVVSGLFVMDMLVDLKDMTISLHELITGALELGKKNGVEVMISLQR